MRPGPSSYAGTGPDLALPANSSGSGMALSHLRVRVHEEESGESPPSGTKTLRRPMPSETSRCKRDESDAARRG